MRMYQQRFLVFIKSEEVYNRAMALSRQTTVSMCLTERQVKNKRSDVVRSSVSRWDRCTPGREKQEAHNHATWIWNVSGLQQDLESRGPNRS